MDKMNPVVLVLGVFTTLFAGVGIWSFATALLTRKSDVKQKDSEAIQNLETASTLFREEMRRDNTELRTEVREMKLAIIPLINTLDELLPKMIPCLTAEERIELRDKVNTARMKA
jgi:hypothetical protein